MTGKLPSSLILVFYNNASSAVHVYKIVNFLPRSLECNPNLKHLTLSDNVKVTNEVLLKLLTLPSNLQFLDLSCCGISSPLPEHLVNRQTGFSRHLKYLNLSYNSLNEQDIETLLCLWSSTWREKTSVCITKSIVIFCAKD
jgi:Ran GTPase-activating protein (RanGAP) involved in mRNA processing and transport